MKNFVFALLSGLVLLVLSVSVSFGTTHEIQKHTTIKKVESIIFSSIIADAPEDVSIILNRYSELKGSNTNGYSEIEYRSFNYNFISRKFKEVPYKSKLRLNNKPIGEHSYNWTISRDNC